MQLPQELQQFPSATLIVTADTIHTAFWLVGGDTIESLDGVAMPHDHMEHAEGGYVAADGARTGGPEAPSDASRFHHYVHAVTERLSQLVHGHHIAHVHLVMPANVEHAVADHLPRDVAETIGKRLHVDVMKENPLDVVRRVLAA